jgi:hypothetical protein
LLKWASKWEKTMDQHYKAGAEKPPDVKSSAPRGSPATDPTNPYHQEAAGINAAAEATNERKIGESGLTDADRDRRAANHLNRVRPTQAAREG